MDTYYVKAAIHTNFEYTLKLITLSTDSNVYFTGGYDGENFKITGFEHDIAAVFTYEFNDISLGLFMYIETDHEIKNVRLENVNMLGAFNVVALVVVVRKEI